MKDKILDRCRKIWSWFIRVMKTEPGVDAALFVSMFLQFILIFCRLVRISMNGKLDGEFIKDACDYTVFECVGSMYLTVFGAIFIALALASCMYLFFKDSFNVEVPGFDRLHWVYYLVFPVLSADYNVATLFVSRSYFRRYIGWTNEIVSAAAKGGMKLKMVFTFGGVLLLVLAVVTLLLIVYKVYLRCYRQKTSETVSIEQETEPQNNASC